jgi:hypothetical protein
MESHTFTIGRRIPYNTLGNLLYQAYGGKASLSSATVTSGNSAPTRMFAEDPDGIAHLWPSMVLTDTLWSIRRAEEQQPIGTHRRIMGAHTITIDVYTDDPRAHEAVEVLRKRVGIN